MASKLHKSQAGSRQVSIDVAAAPTVNRKPLPNSTSYPRSLPVPAADHGIFLPPPPAGGFVPPKRHSSYNYSGLQGAPPPGRSSMEGAPDPGATLKVNRLRPSASAVSLGPRPMPTRPAIPVSAQDPAPGTLKKDHKEDKKKHGWFSSKKDKKEDHKLPGAWIIAPGQASRIPFDVDALLAGQPSTDLWDPYGNCFVHLFPDATGKGPSFRVNSSVFASSAILTKKAFGKLYSDPSASSSISPSSFRARNGSGQHARGPATGGSDGIRSTRGSLDVQADEVHLYLDLPFNGRPAPDAPRKSQQVFLSDDAETLIGARNFFALLCGQALVGTERRFTLYSIFMRIADFLQQYEFTNMDGSSFGEVVISSFDSYVQELRLADVRKSVQKNIEMIVLGERMRSVSLYNEAFSHAVGRYAEIQALPNTPLKLVSNITQTRLSRAVMDLEKRRQDIHLLLTNFDFPSIFSGIMSSKTSEESRLLNFEAWRAAFLKMRGFFMGYFKDFYGSWPPKPHAKKNTLQTGGLNRAVLLTLYNDLAALYDLLVDRSDLTNRAADGVLHEEEREEAPRVRALRVVLSEYDRSFPPVKPPIPFDVPKVQTLHSARPITNKERQTDANAKFLSRTLKTEETAAILQATHNRDVPPLPFIQAFLEFERTQAKGCNIQEIADARDGQWIFIYAVLQVLPLLVVDAPGLSHTAGVEYFLCQASRGGVPWVRTSGDRISSVQTWYGVAGGAGGIVSLPSDVIEHSVDSVYRRSHCWQVAERWCRENPLLNPSSVVHHPPPAPRQRDASPGSAILPHPPRSASSQVGLNAPLPPLPSTRSRGDSTSSIQNDPRETVLSPLIPPPNMPAVQAEMALRRKSAGGSRDSSPARGSKRGSVLDLGLEALSAPPLLGDGYGDGGARRGSAQGVMGGGAQSQANSPRLRPVGAHVNDPTKTFDAILAEVASPAKGGKGGKKKK